MGIPGDPYFRERVPIFPVEWGPGSPFYGENRDPYPHIPGKMGMGVPDFGGPHFLMTPVLVSRWTRNREKYPGNVWRVDAPRLVTYQLKYADAVSSGVM